MQAHTSQRGLDCFFPFPKHLHPCSCDHPHWMERAASKAQQGKRIEQRERTQESLNPVPPALSPVQAVLTNQFATQQTCLLVTLSCIHPSLPLHSCSPALGTVEPLSTCHDQAEAACSTQGRKAVCLLRSRPHTPMLEQFSLQVQPCFSLHWL